LNHFVDLCDGPIPIQAETKTIRQAASNGKGSGFIYSKEREAHFHKQSDSVQALKDA
jgi:hypothetical protein